MLLIAITFRFKFCNQVRCRIALQFFIGISVIYKMRLCGTAIADYVSLNSIYVEPEMYVLTIMEKDYV